MSHEIDEILSVIEDLDANRVANFGYNSTAFNNDDADGVASFDPGNDNNIPTASHTDLDPQVLDTGYQAQGASIPQNAWNHFIGRMSYNINKTAQKFKEFLGMAKTKMGLNAGRYDAEFEYNQNDACFTYSVSGSVATVQYWRCLVNSTVGVTPGSDPTKWLAVNINLSSNRSAIQHSGLLPIYALVDLSNTTSYPNDTWFPITSSAIKAASITDGDGATTVRFDVYGERSSGKAVLVVDSTVTGVANLDDDVVWKDTAVDSGGTVISPSPIGYSKLVLGRQRVLWLRGGGKYLVYNSVGATLTIRTSSYDNGADSAIAPNTGRIFSPTPRRVRLRAVVPDAGSSDEAPNLGQVTGLITGGVGAVTAAGVSVAAPTGGWDPLAGGADVQAVLESVKTLFSYTFSGTNARGTLAITDADSPTKSGFYTLLSPYTNGPTGAKHQILHIQSQDSANEATQIAVDPVSGTVYRRMKHPFWSEWGSWSALLTSSSGLNADNLTSGTVSLDRIPATLTGKSADQLGGQAPSYYLSPANFSAYNITNSNYTSSNQTIASTAIGRMRYGTWTTSGAGSLSAPSGGMYMALCQGGLISLVPGGTTLITVGGAQSRYYSIWRVA